MKRRFLAAFLSVAIVMFAAVAQAGPSSDFVKDKQSQLLKLIAADKPDQKAIGGMFDDVLDYGALAKTSLGKEFDGLTPAQQTEFSALLKQLVQQAWQKNLKGILGFDVQYTGDAPNGDHAYLVHTKAVSKSDKRADPIQIDFKISDSSGKMRIVDIVTEEVSLVDSYRTQFVKVLKKDGYDGLVKKMKEKIAKGQ